MSEEQHPYSAEVANEINEISNEFARNTKSHNEDVAGVAEPVRYAQTGYVHHEESEQ